MENTEKSAAPTPTGGGGAKEKLEKQARQLAYDVRYKVRGALKAQSGGKSDPATVKKAYMSQLGKSPANPAVKTRAKQMLVGEDYINLDKVVADSVASAMFKVFVEHHQKDADGNTLPHEEINEDEAKEKTYKVRVTDKESGNSYVRNASRSKIAELRNNPNISSVEMTEYGEVTKSEKYKGSKTASVKSGKGVDYDGDGKVESGSKEHAGVVHNAIQKKKGGTPDGKDTRKENYTWKEAFGGLIEKKSEEDKKITGKGVNNAKLIKVFPDEVKEGYDKKKDSDCVSKSEKNEHNCAKKVCHEKYGIGNCIPEQHTILEDGTVSHYDVEFEEYIVENCPVEDLEILVTEMHSHSAKKKVSEDYDTAVKTKNEKDPNSKAKKEEDEDPRSIPTKMNLIKNKLRAMGLKMSQELEGDSIEEARRADKMGIARKKVTYDKGEETRNPNPDRGAAPSFKPEGGSLAGSKAASRSRSLGDARRKANKKGANLAYGKREGRLASFAANKRDSDSSLGSQKAATDTGAHKDKQGYRQVHKHSERGDKRRPSYNPKHTANTKKEEYESSVQSALESLNTYYSKNDKLQGSLIHNEDAALDFVKKKIEREHGKGAYVSKDNPRKPQSAADKAKARTHQSKVDAENAAARAKDPSQGRYPKG